MKTQTSSHKKIPYFILFSFFLFSFSNSLISQTPLSKYPTSLGGSNLKQYDLGGGISRFGIGLQTNPLEIPAAVFHIKDFISEVRPVFKIDGKNGNESVIGSVNFLSTYSEKIMEYTKLETPLFIIISKTEQE